MLLHRVAASSHCADPNRAAERGWAVGVESGAMRQSEPGAEYADSTQMEWLMQSFIEQAQTGEVVWLTKDGERAGAVVPVEVAEAGLRALGRTDR